MQTSDNSMLPSPALLQANDAGDISPVRSAARKCTARLQARAIGAPASGVWKIQRDSVLQRAQLQSATIISNSVPVPLKPHSKKAMMQSTTATIPVDHSSQ